ncbi:MAG: aminoglycoside phosphotransferase family protein [Alphaproteobacteria bacterium]|nr:aminoglycoside phosphotransferase family protein [Alphaproteobacteria bacterium]
MDPETAALRAEALLGQPAVGPAVPLTGGLLNEVFRVPMAGGSVILKRAPPFVAAAPDIPLDPARAGFEARALGLVADLCAAEVGVPRLLAHQGDTLVMEDLGPLPALDDWLRGGGDPERLEALGAFIGRLHRESAAQADLAVGMDNRAVQETRYAVQYGAIRGMLEAAGLGPGPAARAEDLGRRLLEPGRCLVMGDLWPRSVLVAPDRLWLIDWELSHWGQPAQDLGHLAAHLWMLEQRHGVRGAWVAFDRGYTRARTPTEADRADAAVHLGCEILARTLGPFSAGGPYDGLSIGDPAFDEAVTVAVAALREVL